MNEVDLPVVQSLLFKSVSDCCLQKGFLDFSNEVLLTIFEFLAPAELHAVSSVCRRLHFLALPEYLSYFGIYKPWSDVILEDVKMDALEGICTSLFISELGRLYCSLNAGALPFIKEINLLRRAVSKVSRVQEVRLNLKELEFWRRFIVDGIADHDGWEQWTHEFAEVLNIVVHSKSCSVLTILYGHWGSITDGTTPKRPSRAIFGKALKRLRSIPPAIVHDTKLRSRSASPPVSSSLTTFNIHSSLLLSKSFLSWTLQTIKTSPITTLSLHLSNVNADTMSYFLNSISLSALSSFSLTGSVNVLTKDFWKFLLRHPTITTLTRLSINPRSSYYQVPPAGLPLLTSLTTNPVFIIHLLERPESTPHLSTVVIRCHLRTAVLGSRREMEFSVLNHALATLSRRVPPLALLHLVFEEHDKHGAEAWLREGSARVQRFLRCVERLRMSAGGPWAFGEEVVVWFGEEVVHSVLPHWLSLFERLKRVEFLDGCVRFEGEDARSARARFVDEIGRRCKGVEYVCIDGREYVPFSVECGSVLDLKLEAPIRAPRVIPNFHLPSKRVFISRSHTMWLLKFKTLIIPSVK